MRSAIIKKLKIVAILYFALLIAAAVFQRDLMYFPQKYSAGPDSVELVSFKEVQLTTVDNVNLIAWYKQQSGKAKTIIYLDGNAGRLTHNADFFKSLSDAGYGVLGLAYRGYGKSGGKPSEAGFYNDARAAIEFLKKSVPENSIIVVGRSVGTGVAVQMGKEYNLGGVVLISPYTSIEDIAAAQYWYFPVKPLGLVQDKFDSLSKIKLVTEPLLIIHGDKDTLIPITYGKTLFNAANNPKYFVTFPESDHISFNKHKLVHTLKGFLEAK